MVSFSPWTTTKLNPARASRRYQPNALIGLGRSLFVSSLWMVGDSDITRSRRKNIRLVDNWGAELMGSRTRPDVRSSPQDLNSSEQQPVTKQAEQENWRKMCLGKTGIPSDLNASNVRESRNPQKVSEVPGTPGDADARRCPVELLEASR